MSSPHFNEATDEDIDELIQGSERGERDNRFFEKFGPGNSTGGAQAPYERFKCYEDLLRRIRKRAPTTYAEIHKGTPFYFMSWCCFDMHSYEQALFYIDAAVSEDVRAWKGSDTPDNWRNAPAARFLTLEYSVTGGEQTAKRTIDEITRLLTAQLERFNRISGKSVMDLDRWRKFVTPLLDEPMGTERSKRTIVSALYVFMLEFQARLEELEFRRGSLGGSNQPFTVHLFTGGLLFESLIKHFYPRSAPDSRTLDKCLEDKRFKGDFEVKQIKCNAVSLGAILNVARTNSSAQTAFEVAGRLRNTTGHNLVWDDVFDNPEYFKILYEQVMNALLFLIERKTL